MSDTTRFNDLEAAHAHCALHRAEVERSSVCGCFYCRETFEPTAIREWIADRNVIRGATGETALCPRCGIDSVIGSASGYPITPDFLARMRARWFE